MHSRIKKVAASFVCVALVLCPALGGTLAAPAPVPVEIRDSSPDRAADDVPAVPELTATYRTVLDALLSEMPPGFSWPSGHTVFVGDVGLQTHVALYREPGTDGPWISVPVTIRVVPKDGSLCTISAITNEAEASRIVITDGTVRLTKGVDYTVSSSVSGNTVTITISFAGNYTGTAVRTFTFGSANSWVQQPAIQGWVAGSTPSVPAAVAAYGTPAFTYIVNGAEQSEPPSAPGSYILVATVPPTSSYGALREEVPFTVYAAVAPAVNGLTAEYRTRLSSVQLPAGFSWTSPNTWVGDVGSRSFPALYVPTADASGTYLGGSVDLAVQVTPRDGANCTISPVTNEEEARNVRITDGTYTLVKGTDYYVTSSVTGHTVTVTISFRGNYTGTVERTFTFGTENRWTSEVSISNWISGQTPGTPSASAIYGTPQFTYLADGAWTAEQPSSPGSYTVRATVPGTLYYDTITSEATFTIYAGVAPAAGDLTAVYGSTLSSVALPDGFAWSDPSSSVGNAGMEEHEAVYTPTSSEYAGGAVRLAVRVTPFPGNQCQCSPVTNEYEGRNIRIENGSTMLVKGRDYLVSSDVSGDTVTVTIHFIGNYSGTMVHTFTFSAENGWLVPLSIENWIAGETPSQPAADSKYGEPVYSYLVNGAWQTEQPVTAGTYTCRAIVPATVYYDEISAQTDFTIYAAKAPDAGTLQAVYTDPLSAVRLPAGFAWLSPETGTGDAGLHLFPALYTPETAEYMGGDVDLQVEVLPKDGSGFTVSPITNGYEATHVTVRDGETELEQGKDFSVSLASQNAVVTVVISFMGNYTGSITRTFTITGVNEWIVPLSIRDWTAGSEPSVPVADSKFGTVSFFYTVNGIRQDDAPAEPGTYLVTAEVAATEYYNGLTATVTFQILPPADLTGTVLRPKEGADLKLETTFDSEGVFRGPALTATSDGTTVENALTLIEAAPASSENIIQALGRQGTLLAADSIISTGDQIRLVRVSDPETALDTAFVAVRGDVLGTGRMSLSQLVRMASAYRAQMNGEGEPLRGAYLAAGDLDGNGRINLTDLVYEADLYRSKDEF